jgi:hypothetical protein
MRKLILLFTMLTIMTACGDKKKAAENTLTPEQESMLVDSIGQELENSTNELSQQADSLTNDVDSLLQGI